MAWINATALSCAAGSTPDDLWQALIKKTDLSTPVPWNPKRRAFLFSGPRPERIQALLVKHLGQVTSSALRSLSGTAAHRTAVLFASTKGMSEDFIWRDPNPHLHGDPLTPILQNVLEDLKLQPGFQLSISNACSSTLAAVQLGQHLLTQEFDRVIVLAADAVSPFVLQGFEALKLISDQRPRPFAADRNGFWLGEAAACLVLERERAANGIFVHPIGLDTEGSAVTRPARSGASLERAALRTGLAHAPDLIFAHGTGTRINDETENLVFHRLCPASTRTRITGSKGSVGHTLAVSGAIDLILAIEALRRGEVFALPNTPVVGEEFGARYLTGEPLRGRFRDALISSLGFGGMHAMAWLERVE